MSLWGQMSHADGQALANSLSAYRPFVGRTVRVDKGRKHLGTLGTVTWHGVDHFSKAGRYGGPDVQSVREVMGRWGYRVRVQPLDGSEPFFVSAENVMVSVPSKETTK